MEASRTGTSVTKSGTVEMFHSATRLIDSADLGKNRRQCFCYNQFDVQNCSVQGIYSTHDVLEHDELSLHCPKLVNNWQMELRSKELDDVRLSPTPYILINSVVEQVVRYPIPDEEVSRLKEALTSHTTRPRAFILGHGLWNDLDLRQCGAWLDSIIAPIHVALKHRSGRHGRTHDGQLPILLVTPNAAGERKPNEWLITQGNKALVGFEKAMAVDAAKRGIDHLGTWNMSIQATLYDGVHMDLRGNLVKAMMVLNWLDLLEFQRS